MGRRPYPVADRSPRELWGNTLVRARTGQRVATTGMAAVRTAASGTMPSWTTRGTVPGP
jgi:hypothetical protein